MKKQVSLKFFITLLICNFYNFGFSQHALQYDSVYSPAKGLNGTAKYEYTYDLDHLEIKSGPFSFESNQNDTSWTSVNEEHYWTGQYEVNKKSGEWVYETIQHDVDILSIEDNHLEYNLRTIKSNLTAYYKKGTPSGTWIYESELILKDGEPSFFEKITIPFNKGYADGVITFEFVDDSGKKGLVTGKCQKGLFVGEWTFIYSENNATVTETRNYKNGVLLKIEKTQNNNLVQSIDFLLSEQTKNVIFENKGKNHLVNKPYSLVFNDGYNLKSNFVTSQLSGNTLLKNLQNKILRFDQSWAKKNRLIFGSNRGKYPLTETEEDAISDWYKLEQEFQLLVEDIKEKEIRGFGTSQDSIAVFTLKWVERQEEIFERIASLSQVFLSKEIEYIHRSNLLLEYTIDFLSTDTLINNTQKVIISYPVKPEAKTEIFAFMAANFDARIKKGKRLEAELSTAKKSTTLEEELELLPKRIEEEKNKLDSLFLKLPEEIVISTFIENIEQNFLTSQIEPQYKRFKETKNKKAKKAIGDSILVNLNTIDHIYSKAILIAERSKYLDSLYTEYVFDSFTFSDNVPSRYKKKLFDQVHKLNLELISLATESKQPATCLDYLNKVYEIQGTLIYLHDKKTKTLENNLRKAKSLDERINLLNEIL